MANPIAFKPLAHDPHVELERRLAAAPREHAEALLVAYELLQTAHDQGLLDLAHGLVGGRDVIALKLAAAGNQPESIAALRNLISVGKILGALDPETLDHLARALAGAQRETDGGGKAPGLWALVRQALSADSRRGLGFLLTVLSGLGRSTKR